MKRLLPMFLFVASPLVRAAEPAVLWVNALGGAHLRADLRVDGTALFRQLPQGTICPWFRLPAGTHRYEVGGTRDPGLTGEWSLAADTRMVFITYGTELAMSRSIPLPKRRGHVVFNAVDDALLQAGDARSPAARTGFSLPLAADGGIRLTLANGGSWLLSPIDSSASAGTYFLTLHRARCDHPADLAVAVSSLVDGGADTWLLSAGAGTEPKSVAHAAFRAAFTPAPAPPPQLFDPLAIDWTKVKSQFAWFNATPDNQSLAIGGMRVYRQMKAGDRAMFSAWPAGTYQCQSISNQSGKTGTASFELDEGKRIVLVSIARKDEAAKVHVIAAAPQQPPAAARKKPASTVRVMNALPGGILRLPAPQADETLASGGISAAVDAASLPPGYPALLVLATPDGGDVRMKPKSPDRAKLPGDWVLIVHLSPTNPDSFDYAWLNFTDGRLLTREDLGKDAPPDAP